MSYRKILVAYNGSPESRAALDECARLSLAAEAEVHLLGVVYFPGTYLLAGEYVPEAAFEAEEKKRLEADLSEAHQLLAGQGLQVIDHLAAGEPVEVIAKLATELKVELIVLGHRRNRSWAARWWRGSVDVSLLERSGCSILIAVRA